jgi:HAD superfamily hydrolase (TIGR01484 family)
MYKISTINAFKLNPTSLTSFRGVQPSINQSKDKYLFAFDLDGTFLNGTSKDFEEFANIAKQKNYKLAYVTGRSSDYLDKIKESFAAKGIDLPLPDYFIATNGLFLYEKVGNKMCISEEWNNHLASNGYEKNKVKKVLNTFIDQNKIDGKSMMVQFDHKPLPFNTEYYVSHKIIDQLPAKIQNHLSDNGIPARVIAFPFPQKLIDKYIPDNIQNQLEPLRNNKGEGIYKVTISAADKSDTVEFLRQKLNIDKQHVVTAGDDGNDISLADKGFWFIAVHNAKNILLNSLDKLSKELKEKTIKATQDGLSGINECLNRIFKQND